MYCTTSIRRLLAKLSTALHWRCVLAGYSSCWMQFGTVRLTNHNSWNRFWTSTSGRPVARACGPLKEFVHCRPTADLLLTLPRLCTSSLSANCRSPESSGPRRVEGTQKGTRFRDLRRRSNEHSADKQARVTEIRNCNVRG